MHLLQDTLLALIETPPTFESESSLARALGSTGQPVETFSDPSACLAALKPGRPVVFVVDHAAARSSELLWMILLAESGQGPVLLVTDEESRRETLERAGVDALIDRDTLEAGVAMLPAFLDTLIAGKRSADAARTATLERDALRESSASEAREVDQFRRETEHYVRDSLHEFRTPLTSMHEFAAILRDGLGGPLTDKQHEYLEYVLRGTQDMLELFDDFRDAIRLRLDDLPTLLGQHDVGEIVNAAVAEAETDRVTFEVEMPHRGGPVYADAGQLRKSIARVMSHAAKSTPRGGKVRLQVQSIDGETLEFAIYDGGPSPTEGDGILLREGTVKSSLQRKSVTKVFGIGVELARALLLRNGGCLSLRPQDGDAGSILSFQVPKQKGSKAGRTPARVVA